AVKPRAAHSCAVTVNNAPTGGSPTPMADKPVVIVTRKLPDLVEQRMAELFDVRLNADDRPFTEDRLKAAVAEADVLVPTVTDTIDASVIAAAGSKLVLIANFGNGVDNIDVAAATERRIIVTNTPG